MDKGSDYRFGDSATSAYTLALKTGLITKKMAYRYITIFNSKG